jgi:hypothetical protein
LLGLGLPKMPSQPSISRFLANGAEGVAAQVLQLSRDLGRRMRRGQRTGILDLDGSVIATRGNPKGAEYGYNPRRRGKTYFACLSFCGHTREILDAVLCSGNEATISARRAIRMYCQGRRALGPDLKRLHLRADAGFASHDFVRRLQCENVTYFIAWVARGGLRAKLVGLDYQPLDERYAVAEFTYRVRRGRLQRMVVIREKLEPDERHKKQLRLLEAPGYAYQIIATNAPEGWSGAAVWRFYNHRSCLENIIKEWGYALDSSGTELAANRVTRGRGRKDVTKWLFPKQIRNAVKPIKRRRWWRGYGGRSMDLRLGCRSLNLFVPALSLKSSRHLVVDDFPCSKGVGDELLEDACLLWSRIGGQFPPTCD